MGGLRHGPVVPQVEALLREMLRDGRWQVGDRLPNEVQLAADLGVGRSSVREAVRLLARDGLLDVRHGSGTYVAVPDVLRRARTLEIYEVRRALEVEAARLAAERVRPEDLETLRARLRERQDHLTSDPAAFVRADLDFHRAIVELSGNAVLLGLYDSTMPALAEVLTEMMASEQVPDVSGAHAGLLDALVRRDAQAAITATVEHLETVMEYLRA